MSLPKKQSSRVPWYIGGIFLLLWGMVAVWIWQSWVTGRQGVEREVRAAAEDDLKDKAHRVAEILQRTYHTIRTVSLLPGVRGAREHNRTSTEEDVVVAGYFSPAEYETVQQLYNQIAASVDVSEIYVVLDGFAPERGQVPFLMFDEVLLERIRDNSVSDLHADRDADVPEEVEDEEYVEYVNQLTYFRTHEPRLPADISLIKPHFSAPVRTCDNSQYLSVRNGDVAETRGIALSVPIYALDTRKFKGLVSAILRNNVLEAALIDRPFVPVLPGERARYEREFFNYEAEEPSNLLLEYPPAGIRIYDRRNSHWAERAGEPVQGAGAISMQVALDVPGTKGWVMGSYVSAEALETALAPLRERLRAQFLIASASIVSLCAALMWIFFSQRRSSEMLERLVYLDALTSLPNRRFLLERLRKAVVRVNRRGGLSALLFIDLDNFKSLNDTQGHDVGDLLLQEVASRLRNSVRTSDTVARLGGDEFVVLLEDLPETDNEALMTAEGIGDKVLRRLNDPYTLRGTSFHSTPSIGVAMVGNDGAHAEELMKRADLAMYQAKNSGRNAIRVFDAQMLNPYAERLELESEINAALSRGEFLLHFQPQVNAEGVVTGAEALARWQHPQRGMVAPMQFITVAEDTGLIVPLGQRLMQLACEHLASWASQRGISDLTIAVNVSAQQFMHRHFVEMVVQTLERTGARPEKLELELTESMLANDIDVVANRMQRLRELGIRFSLDDFGTGFSSLSLLKRLPLSQLKIDRSFIQDLETDKNDAAMVRAMVGLAANLGMHVIAEGVETEIQRQLLLASGCRSFQGFLFGKPMSPSEFERKVGVAGSSADS